VATGQGIWMSREVLVDLRESHVTLGGSMNRRDDLRLPDLREG